MTTYANRGQRARLARGGARGWFYKEDHVMPTLRGGRKLFHARFYYSPNGWMSCRGSEDPKRAYSIDGASIPKWAQWLIRKDAKTLQAAGPHDLNYQLGRIGVWDRVKDARKRIDKQFLADMKHFGVGWTKRRIMYTAVRIGGASSFRD